MAGLFKRLGPDMLTGSNPCLDMCEAEFLPRAIALPILANPGPRTEWCGQAIFSDTCLKNDNNHPEDRWAKRSIAVGRYLGLWIRSIWRDEGLNAADKRYAARKH